MPMYDFECKACGHTFETVAKVDELPACPECQSADVSRLISAPAIKGAANNLSFNTPKGSRDPKKVGTGRAKTG